MTENNDKLENLRRAYKADPNDKDAATDLAQLYTDLGWLNEAIIIYENLIKAYSDDFSILLAYGNTRFSKQEIKESLIIFKKLTILKPKRVEGWNNLGIVQLANEDYESAKKSFQKVLQLEPENHGALLNMGNYYDHLGNCDKAIAMFKRATAVRPYFTDAWFNLGNAYIQKKQFQKAIDAYKKSLQYNPKFYSAFKNIGFAYEQMEEYEKAEEYYIDALGINKTDAALYVNLATTYTKQMRYDKAKDYYLRSVKISPNEAVGWLGLRELSLKKGDIKTYVKSTCAVLHRLDDLKIAESLHVLRKMQLYHDIDTIISLVDKLKREHDEIDAEKMLAYYRSNKKKTQASLLYKRISGIISPSDHILGCLADYCVLSGVYDKAIHYVHAIKEKDALDFKLVWIALIEKKELKMAEKVITIFLNNNQDCFDGWYHLARLNVMTGQPEKAQKYLVRALETGFIEFDQIEKEPQLKRIYNSLSK